MAKQLVGPIERHIEKIVAGIAGVLLVGVIAKFLATSPNYLELDGERIAPANIADKVNSKASDVRDRIRGHRPAQESPEPLYPSFIKGLDPFTQAGIALNLAGGIPFGPEIPVIDPGETIKGQKKLVEVYKLPKPSVTFGRSTFVDVEGAAGIVDNWVTVSAMFDRKQQTAIQKRQYGAKHDEVVFGPVQLQRRALSVDGRWSDDHWEEVETWPAAELPRVPTITTIMQGDEEIVPHDVSRNITDFYNEIMLGPLQVELLRPLMPDVYNGTPWLFPILTSYRDVLLEDQKLLSPDAEEGELDDRYGLLESEDAGQDDEELTAQQEIAQWFRLGDQLLARALKNSSGELAIDAYNLFQDIIASRNAIQADKSKAKRKRAEAEQAIRDIERRRGKPKRGAKDDGTPAHRELAPQLQVWAHDARHKSVTSGKTYQYRMRVLLFNQLAGDLAQFASKSDARVVLVGGEWSEPSDPVAIEPDSRFFLTGFDERKRRVKIELFAWFDGVWVTHKQNFRVGDTVSARARKEVPIPGTDERDRPEVLFDSGVGIVDIDFERPNRERRVKDGVTLTESLATTCSAVFVDQTGKLSERFVLTDKANPDRRRLSKRVGEWKQR